MHKESDQIIDFLHEAELLKSVMRHSWLSSGRRESTAEHTWRMALMAMLIHPHLKKKPDLNKVIKMVLVHDLVEVYAGDVPAWAKDRSKKDENEDRAMKKLIKFLSAKQGKEFYGLWKEYQQHKTLEAKFVKAMDRLEAKIQHQESDFKHISRQEIKYNLTGGEKECAFDPFLAEVWQDLKNNWLKIYKKNKVAKKLYQ